MKRTARAIIAGTISAAMLAASAMVLPVSAQAAGVTRADGSYELAQWRGHPNYKYNRGYHRGPGWRGPGGRAPGYYYPRGHRYYGWRGPGYYGGSYYYNPGAAFAAGVLGLAAGAAIAGSMNQQRGYSSDYYAYCSQRYRSFNPSTGNYTGYDGRQHRCVMP